MVVSTLSCSIMFIYEAVYVHNVSFFSACGLENALIWILSQDEPISFISQWTTLMQDPKSMKVRGVPVGCLLHPICLQAHHRPKHLSPASSNSRKRRLLGTPLRSSEALTPHKMYDSIGVTQDAPLCTIQLDAKQHMQSHPATARLEIGGFQHNAHDEEAAQHTHTHNHTLRVS